MSDKTVFRSLQASIGLFSPKHIVVRSAEEACDVIKTMCLPVLIKPCECSASRGTYLIEKFVKKIIEERFCESAACSWTGKVAIEEFVLMPTMSTFEGEIFINGENVFWDGLFHVQRSSQAPMIPMTYFGPISKSDPQFQQIKLALTKVFNVAGIVHGQYNVELYFTKEGLPFIIEINTRQGGRDLPEFVKDFSGVDMTKLLISTCMGDESYMDAIALYNRKIRYCTHHLVFSHIDGIYNGIEISDEVQLFVKSKGNI